MSRHSFEARTPGVTVAIGWDAPLATYFLQVADEDGDEPLIWRGGRYGEYPEPGPLLDLARQWSDVRWSRQFGSPALCVEAGGLPGTDNSLKNYAEFAPAGFG